MFNVNLLQRLMAISHTMQANSHIVTFLLPLTSFKWMDGSMQF